MTTRHGVVIFMSYLINHLVLINDGMDKQFLGLSLNHLIDYRYRWS